MATLAATCRLAPPAIQGNRERDIETPAGLPSSKDSMFCDPVMMLVTLMEGSMMLVAVVVFAIVVVVVDG